MSTKTWAYCAEFPHGKLFDAIPKGWVDSPAKIKEPKKRVTKKRQAKK